MADPSSKESPIGGFFELETPHGNTSIHDNAIALSTGRSCLLAAISHIKPTRCFLPHYNCDATIEPFKKLGIECHFYKIDQEFRHCLLPDLKESDCLLYTNYFGLLRQECIELSRAHGSNLIIDNTHDFFWEDVPGGSWSFTSARKYFGVPDGAFLSVPQNLDPASVVPKLTPSFNQFSLQHSNERLKGNQQRAFELYQAYEASLPCELFGMSKYSASVLSCLDLKQAAEARIRNFRVLHGALGDTNKIRNLDHVVVPFMYPFYPESGLQHRQLHEHNIFAPRLWPDVIQRVGEQCKQSCMFAENLIPLPVDHRYDKTHMQRIIETVHRLQSENV